MAIIGTLPNTLLNGTIADASQVMADFNFIVNQVNANAVAAGTAQPGQLINVQIFTANATYTPSAGMRICIATVQGGGGAGGGAGGATGGNVGLGAPGASGACIQALLTAVQVGASQTVNVGVGGLGVSSSTGGTGSASSVGALLTANGGTGGGILNNTAPPAQNGNGGLVNATGSGQQIFVTFGNAPLPSFAITNTVVVPAPGGASFFGNGGTSPGLNTIGTNASNYGSGGSGVVLNAAGGGTSGGNGKAGIVIIYEYA